MKCEKILWVNVNKKSWIVYQLCTWEENKLQVIPIQEVDWDCEDHDQPLSLHSGHYNTNHSNPLQTSETHPTHPQQEKNEKWCRETIKWGFLERNVFIVIETKETQETQNNFTTVLCCFNWQLKRNSTWRSKYFEEDIVTNVFVTTSNAT